jgi:pimeloyl-ACP methyl ester carboxylesterase
VSAREGYLRAYTYLRSGLIFLSPVSERERYTAIYGKARDFFRCAARLFEPAIEPVEIAFEDGTLPAYFRAGSTEGQKRSTLIMIGGGDTFVEDLYAYIGPAAARRGWNLLMVDLPGQGLLPFDGMVWRADAERSISAVIDYLETRKEVDRERIAVYGISGGGYLAPRAAAKEKRIAACATCSIILDLTGVWNRRITDLWEKAQRSLPHKILKKMVEIWRGSYVTVVDTYVWRMGSGTVQGLVPTTEDCVLDPAEISCPLLNINSEQEYAESPLFRRWADTAKEKAPHPANRFLIAPRNEGGDSHAVGSNLSLMAQMVFDWLEEVFEP